MQTSPTAGAHSDPAPNKGSACASSPQGSSTNPSRSKPLPSASAFLSSGIAGGGNSSHPPASAAVAATARQSSEEMAEVAVLSHNAARSGDGSGDVDNKEITGEVPGDVAPSRASFLRFCRRAFRSRFEIRRPDRSSQPYSSKPSPCGVTSSSASHKLSTAHPAPLLSPHAAVLSAASALIALPPRSASAAAGGNTKSPPMASPPRPCGEDDGSTALSSAVAACGEDDRSTALSNGVAADTDARTPCESGACVSVDDPKGIWKKHRV
mmetsp:Transcript_56837/g.158300  ORF Transcript_56837/g.158300 Transcript_56837/m.158300 type:complete len:267 (-) Transcript_56837:1024-1824(-)